MRHLALAAALLTPTSSAFAVTPVKADPFIQFKANPFDLSHKRLLFTPDSAGGYSVQVSKSPPPFQRGEFAGAPPGSRGPRGNARLDLAFPFPFGNKKWTELYFNYGGNITFGASGNDLFPELDTWPSGTMRWVAGEFDAMSLAGRALMIAPLWNEYAMETSKIYVNSSAREFIATWDVMRNIEPNVGYSPLGRNFFQVRLTPDRVIEIRYGAVAERDGIAGVFSGQPQRKVLDSAANSVLEDVGTAFHIALKLPEPLPQKSPREILVGGGLSNGTAQCQADIRVNAAGRSTFSSCTGYVVAVGSSVDIYISKLNAGIGDKFGWAAGATAEGIASRIVHLDNPGRPDTDLSTAHGVAAGNIYEVFHYPAVSKQHVTVYKELYRHVPAEDDLAIVMTDFRIDDLFNHGGGVGPLNVPIQGIGVVGVRPRDGKREFGSAKLQMAVGPVYLGPRFQENPNDGKITYHNYAFAVGWMAHELGHRWSGFLAPDMVHDGLSHWNDFLHAPVVEPVWRLFSDTLYPEASNMGGYLYEPRADGAFIRRPDWVPAMGLSALDLYVMGLIPPEEVPDTFLLTNTKETAPDVFTGEKVPIRIADIVKASGPRTPPAASSPREFKLGMYLLYDGRKPRPEKVAQLQAIEKMLSRYFTVATGGRMKLSPARGARN
jgi:hypothetical protein